MDAATLAECTDATMADAIKYADPLTLAMAAFEIDTPKRQAAFLATVSVESMRLSKVEEGLYYKDPQRLVKIFPRVFKSYAQAEPYAKNPSALSEILYGGYHGRALLQLTWEKNYQAAADALAYDYVNNPDLLLEPEHAAMVSAWFWKTNGCNEPADRGDMRAVTRIVNGPAMMHLEERIEQYEKALKVLS